ncbi:50S ribosomal protein L5 [Candidatus Daviesbacteria bacterium]|nr:50S ribosomal protein L5 [Candidatus Daviesbacteria bacterium]
MNRLKDKYLNEVKKKLKESLNLTNNMSLPSVKKVVINMGVGEGKDNSAIIEKCKVVLTAIAGQRPVVTKAKKSISSFKLTEGAPIGLMVTLRGEKMYSFLDKLINIVLPKVRDFRGVSDSSFDNQGNFNLGLREQTIFPEVNYKDIDKPRGMQVTVTTTAKNKEQGKLLLELLGVPFRKN